MKISLICLTIVGVASCANPIKEAEDDRRNLFQTQFFYERGFPGRALESAGKVKKSSPRYPEAREWIDRIEAEREAE